MRITAVTILTALSALIIFHPFSSPSSDQRLRIDFLDVGQGDSALVTFPNGATLLIDGGGRRTDSAEFNSAEIGSAAFEPDMPGIGESVVSEFLWEKGYSQIDLVLATHSDLDHMQGLLDVLNNFQVQELLIGPTPTLEDELGSLLEAARQNGVRIREVSGGDHFSIGSAKVEVLSPLRSYSKWLVSPNDRSVVLRISYGVRKFLLTGDIESKTEGIIARVPTDLKADVVKVPHHGSRTSSTVDFVNGVAAEIAVISVGRRSQFGHPHADVLARWKLSGTRVLTTGESGTITISTNGSDLHTQSFVD